VAASPLVQDFHLLLEVFSEGLKLGVISKDEIIAWADEIIADTEKPDYFFIELSLSHDINGLLEVLDRYVKGVDDPICYRVLLGLVYHRQPIYDIEEAEKIATLVGTMQTMGILTAFEENTIYEFSDYDMYYTPDSPELQAGLINFLGIYKAFTLENYQQWISINEQVLDLLKEEEIRVNKENESFKKAWSRKAKKKKIIRYIATIAAFLLFLGVYELLIIAFEKGSQSGFGLYFYAFYFLIVTAFCWWQRKQSPDSIQKY
jgi:hypothetical protein